MMVNGGGEGFYLKNRLYFLKTKLYEKSFVQFCCKSAKMNGAIFFLFFFFCIVAGLLRLLCLYRFFFACVPMFKSRVTIWVNLFVYVFLRCSDNATIPKKFMD